MIRFLLVATLAMAATSANAASPVPNQFVAGTPAKAADVNANFAAVVAQLTALEAAVQAAAVPVGSILPFAGAEAPAGYLLCDGGVVSRTTYAALFAVLGVSHGVGDSMTTFNVPDYRGRFLRGVDGGVGRDPDAVTRSIMATGGNAGDAVGSVQGQATALPATPFTTASAGEHTHQAPTNNGLASTFEVADGAARGYDYGSQAPPTTAAGAHGHVVDGGGDAETRPENAAVNWIIKY